MTESTTPQSGSTPPADDGKQTTYIPYQTTYAGAQPGAPAQPQQPPAYGAPAQPQQPPAQPQQQPAYGAPGQPYGAPSQPAYGAPAQQAYGAPSQPAYQPSHQAAPQSYGAPAAYGQPGAPAYGSPGGHRSSGNTRSFGVAAALLALIAAALGIVSFVAVDWFSHSMASSAKFSDVHRVAVAANDNTIAKFYFSWLGWVVLAVAVVFALIAALPSGVSVLGRIVGILAGLGGIALTFLALPFAGTGNGLHYSDYLKHASVGFYLAVAAFLVAAAAAAVGSRRAG